MPGSFGSLVWFLGTVLELIVVVCAVSKGCFRRYLCLNLYMLFSFFASIGRFQILIHYGLESREYAYCYFYSDAVLTILLYFALITLYLHVFDEMGVERYVRLTALLLLAGTALFSYQVVEQSTHRVLTHFSVELSQNLYFVGLILTYVLWGAILKLRETRTKLIQLVLSLGVYFSALAATYALRNLYPNFQYSFFVQVPGCILPLAWAYAFWRLPEEARLVPSRLAVVPR